MGVFISSQYDTLVYLRSYDHITKEEHSAPSEELATFSSIHEDDGAEH
jgi:hypothetical protein